MAQYDPLIVRSFYRKGKKCYYSYDDELYAATFPEEWVENHLDGTGPKDCGNCAFYGSWNGVFIGYCCNCAIHDYYGTRGRGFIHQGHELMDDSNQEIPSAFDTYLKYVNHRDVGDVDFNNSLETTGQLEFMEENTDITRSILNNILERSVALIINYDEVNLMADILDNNNQQIEENPEYGFPNIETNGYGSNHNGGYDSY